MNTTTTFSKSQEKNSLLAAAIRYAGYRWKVFPCKPNGKKPLTENGYKNATNDIEQIKAWWGQWPDANIGLALQLSGLVAVDVDAYKKTCKWESFIEGKEVPETVTQTTAREGRHYIFRDGERGYRGKLCKSVDIKHNGYVLLSPSRFEGNEYTIDLKDDDDGLGPYVAPAPDWLPPISEKVSQKVSQKVSKRNAAELSEYDRARVLHVFENPLNEIIREDWVKLCFAAKRDSGDDPEIKQAFIDWSERWEGDEESSPDPNVDLRALAEETWNTADINDRENAAGLGTVFFHLGTPKHRPEWDHLEGAPGTDIRATHSALLKELERIHGDKIRYNYTTKQWLVWGGSYWKPDSKSSTHEMIRKLCESHAQTLDTKADRKQLETLRFWKDVEEAARFQSEFATTHKNWNTDDFLIACPTVTVDLCTGDILEPDPKHLISQCTSSDPDKATPELWLKFLHETFGGDKELIRMVQQIFGMCLTGNIDEQKFFFLIGSGGNGKSVFLSVLRSILADYHTKAEQSAFTANRFGTVAHQEHLAVLHGARAVTVSETDKEKSWALSTIKEVTGGEPIRASRKGEKSFEFDPKFTLLIAGNHKPYLGETGSAMERRLVLVPFNHKPENPDPDLTAKLMEEAGSILWWAIQGCVDWKQNGFKIAQSSKDATQSYFQESDPIGQWFDESIEVTKKPADFIPSKEMYEAYEHWLEEYEGDPPNHSQKEFTLYLKSKKNLECSRKWIGSERPNGFQGVKFIDQGE